MNEDKIVDVEQQKVSTDFEQILEEVEKDIAPVVIEDWETAEFLKDVMLDYRLSGYFMFRWLDSMFFPEAILYPGSGFDKIPLIAFGKEKVVHTSIEEYEDGGQNYFDELGDAIKVIADNRALPFPSSLFQVILLLDSSFEIIGEERDEILRVLSTGGIIVFARNILQDDLEVDRIAHYLRSDFLRELPLPAELRRKGESETSFYIFCKIH